MDSARIKSLHKTPTEEFKVGWDWVSWLATGDTVASATHTPTGCTVTGAVVDGTRTVYMVAGGTVGVAASVLTTMTTTAGEDVQARIDFTIGAA